jgi:hypothetical protein
VHVLIFKRYALKFNSEPCGTLYLLVRKQKQNNKKLLRITWLGEVQLGVSETEIE